MTPDSHAANTQHRRHGSYDKRMKEEYQIRNRTILRRPHTLDSEDDEGCRINEPVSYMPDIQYEQSPPQASYLLGQHHENLLPLQERRSCSESEACKAMSYFRWSLTSWSSCLPKNMNADSTCGEGVRRYFQNYISLYENDIYIE